MSTLKSINLVHPSSINNNIVLDANGSINVSNSLFVSGSNVLASLSSANTWANTKLSNTAGVTFAGDLYFPVGSNVSIGSGTPTSPLSISLGGTVSLTQSGTLIDADGSSNSYLQLSIRNANTGSQASIDFIATTDDGTDATNYIDLGINDSGFATSATWSINGARDGYLYVQDSNLSIGSANTTSSAKFINFFVGGALSTDEAMRIQDSAGGANVGIGRTNPGYKLDVVGSINASAILVNASQLISMDYAFANGVANSANAYTVTVGAAANTFATSQDNNVRAFANSTANSANAYTVTVGAAANTFATSQDNNVRAFANSTANSANAYTVTVGAASNTWANTKVTGNLATSVASTSGRTVDFVGLPTTTNRIAIQFERVSTNGTASLLIQPGSGSPNTTGYLGTSTSLFSSALPVTAQATSGAQVYLQTGDAATGYRHGSATLTKVSGNTWAITGIVSSNTAAYQGIFSYTVPLPGFIDRVRIIPNNASDNFDAGVINIYFEY